jgi:gliding motility-associated-like protein
MELNKKKLLILLMTTISGIDNIFPQNPDIKRTWHWYFGNGAGLDFSSGFPVADTTGKLHSYESCAVMSDTAGNLLFYTDGDTVWDRRHIMMPNGYGLKGCGDYVGSSAKGTIIIPQPQKDSIYYIITVDCWENSVAEGLRYSIINMNKNSGYGDVVIKNKLLFNNPTEGITATKSVTGDTIWIATYEHNNDIYRIYRIDKNGLDTIPIINKIGGIHSDYVTYMNFSQNGNYLAAYNVGNINADLMNFNLKTGELFNHIRLPEGGNGACFSPDNSKLYFTTDGTTILQYNLCAEDIAGSLIKLYDPRAPDNSTYGAISVTADTSIMLISSVLKDKISYIIHPNSIIDTGKIAVLSISLLGRYSHLGFPNFIQSYFHNNSQKNPCTSETININNNETQNSLVIPNIFTPNNDNINDYFTIQVSGYVNIEYFIYNRWGNLIHEGKKELNPEIKAEERLWDGRYKGNEVPAGVYFFLIKAIKMNGEEEIKKGFIQLLR